MAAASRARATGGRSGPALLCQCRAGKPAGRPHAGEGLGDSTGGARTPHGRSCPGPAYPALIERMTELHSAGHSSAQIAEVLNQEGRRPPKRRDTYNTEMVRKCLVAAGIVAQQPKKLITITARGPDEWMIRELAEHIGMPQATLYHWVKTGRLRYRTIEMGAKVIKLVAADAATIADLKAMRTRPAYPHRLPPSDGGGPLNLTS